MEDKCKNVVVVGASGYPELAGLIDDINQINKTVNVIALLDDNTSLQGSEILGIPVTGDLDKANEYEIVEVFGKVVNTVRGVKHAKRFNQRIVSDNPQACVTEWIQVQPTLSASRQIS